MTTERLPDPLIMNLTKIKFKLIFFLFLFFFILGLAKSSQGTTRTAASCSYADILAAYTSASAGDTVSIPAGTCAWGPSDHLNITKQISIIGAGTTTPNLTKIIHNVLDDDSSATPATFNINVTSDVPVRISGIYFDKGNNVGGSYPNDYREAIHINGSANSSFALTKIRIDNNFFNKGDATVYPSGYVYGVIDSNTFLNCNVAIFPMGDEDYTWNRPISAGTADSLFIENNTFILDGNFGGGSSNEMIYTAMGARTVARYNTYDATAYTPSDTPHLWTSHGNWGSPNIYIYRGEPISEIYNNSVSWNASYNPFISSRGGSILLHDNAFNYLTSAGAIMNMTEEEGWTSGCGGPWGGTQQTTKWPAADNQANTFIWGNTVNGVSNNSVYKPCTGSNGLDDTFISLNRDYFLHPPQASGGRTYYVTNPLCTGSGVAAACCTGKGTGNCLAGHIDATIFTSSGANAYYPYTPYTCPHPLIGLTGTCDPNTPGTSGYNISPEDTTPPAPPTGLGVS